MTKHTGPLTPLSRAASRLPALLLLSSLLLSGLLPGVGGLPGLGSVAWAEIRQPVAQLNLWNRGECTRINDSSFSVPDTARNVAIYRAGVPMRYGDVVGTWRYGLITSVTDAGATLKVTMAGAAKMEATYDGFCEYGSETLLRSETYVVPGTFADADDSTLLLHDLKMTTPKNRGTTRYLVMLCAYVITPDSGASRPVVYAVVDYKVASTSLNVTSVWLCVGPLGRESNYDQRNGENWEIGVTASGTNGDAADLTVQLVWLQEE